MQFVTLIGLVRNRKIVNGPLNTNNCYYEVEESDNFELSCVSQ